MMGEAIGSVTEVVIGRRLWQEWSEYWPSADDPFGQFINPVRKHVVTSTLAGELPWTSAVVDGDQILAILALAMRDDGSLRDDTVVATVMSNLGFRLAMEREKVAVVDTAVGDRYVLEAMKEGSFSLGGEQSGHVIMLEHATTGDGTLTALHVLSRVAATGFPLAELASVMERLPQVLVNVRGVDRTRVEVCEPLQSAVRDAEAELGSTGRVLLRPSGTEPVVRVMVEAADADHAHAVADRLADVVRAELSLS